LPGRHAAAEGRQRVSHQPGIQPRQVVFGTEQHVGGPLGLVGRPVIIQLVFAEQRAVRGMHSAQQAVQFARPVRAALPLQQVLRCGHVGDVGEAVLAPLEGDVLADQFSRQPLAAVDHHVHGEGKPRLQPDVQPAQLRVDQIEIVVQAFPLLLAEFERLPLAVGTDRERRAGLHTTQHADQPHGDAVPLSDLPRQILLPLGAAGDVLQRPFRRFRDASRRVANRVGQPHRVVLELLEQNARMKQPRPQSADVRQPPQRPAKPDPIKATQRSLDFGLMACQKRLHGVTPRMGDEMVTTNHHSTPRRHAFPLWLRPEAALGNSRYRIANPMSERDGASGVGASS
jgi:hypothetical protein